MRRKPERLARGLDKDTIKLFSKNGGSFPNLTYVAADEFNKFAWGKLTEMQPSFNVILSDAMHTLAALMFEWPMIVRGALLDLDDFAVIWDDCVGGLRKAFHSILKHTSAVKEKGLLCSAVLRIHGWMGVHEYPHATCIMTTLDLRNLNGMQAFPVIEDVTCTDSVTRSSDLSAIEKREKCREWVTQFGVQSLKSWGTLPENLQVLWEKYACDIFSFEGSHTNSSNSPLGPFSHVQHSRKRKRHHDNFNKA
jgi:hypothetical protein